MSATTTLRRRRLGSPGEERGGGGGGPLRVAVLLGGIGPERVVSLSSGRGVVEALRARGHDVVPLELASDDESALDGLSPSEVDVVFVALHGSFGEDGRVQRALARRLLPYTGSGPEASARAFDKVRAKRCFVGAGLPVAQDVVLPFPFSERDLRHVLRAAPPCPVVVKPSRLGSSVGVVVCPTRSHVERALRENARFEQPQLVEEYVPGHELTVGVLGDDALPLVEPVPLLGTYDYQAKYDRAAGTTYRVEPQEVPEALRAEARRIGLAAHRALRCEELSRVDLRLDPAKGRIVVLEVNTIPGLTPTSLLPKAAAAAGIPFPLLVERIARTAVRAARR